MESKFLPPKGLNCHRSLSVSSLLNQLLSTWASPLQLSSHLATSFSAVSWKITDQSWTTFLLYISLLIFDNRVCLHHSTECLSLKLQIISTLTNLVVTCRAVLIALSSSAEQPLHLDLIQWHYPLPSNFLAAPWSPLPALPHPLAPYSKNVTVPHSLTFGLLFILSAWQIACLYVNWLKIQIPLQLRSRSPTTYLLSLPGWATTCWPFNLLKT